MKKKIQTVNKHAPQVEFILYHSNDKGYCPAANKEVIGICNARNIVKKVMKLNAKQVELVINKIQDEDKVLVFGKDMDAFFVDKVKKFADVFYLGVK